MARMYPAVIADDHGSHAEVTVFARLRDQTPGDWVALHSVGLAHHATKPWAEIDFVLVTDEGVFCLEVKGGEIEHHQGDWFTNGKRLKESPFAQAGGGASALFEYLSERLPTIKRSVVGHGVLFPETTFDKVLPESEQQLVYDDRDLAMPMESYVRRLAGHWQRRIAEVRGGRPPEGLSRAEISRVVHELAPDFDLIPSLRARIVEAGEELVRLTDQQIQLLEGLRETHRVIVTGGAGTGKTLVACEEAISLAHAGKRTLFVCYGKRLAAYLRPALEQHHVEVAHAHGLMSELIRQAGRQDELPSVEERDLFDIYYPQVAVDALGDLNGFGSYDALVLDEGQDLLKETYVLFFDALLDRELAGGTWRLFYDPNQDLFTGVQASQLERLEQLATSYRLTRNCRNTREIAITTAILSGMKMTDTCLADGPDVTEDWYANDRVQGKCISRRLRGWLDRGVAADQIVVLSPRGFSQSALGAETTRLPRPIVDVSKEEATDTTRLRFSTIAGYKGLEADAVLLTDFDDLTSPQVLEALYVGASRARVLLALVLDERCRETYSARAAELVGRLVEVE